MNRQRQRKLERKRARQRKRKAREVAKTRQRSEPAAYHGTKYFTPRLFGYRLAAEMGINEADNFLRGKLTDTEVSDAVKGLIMAIRQSRPPSDFCHTREQQLVIWRIEKAWREGLRQGIKVGRDGLVGVLRSILGSIESHTSPVPGARSYLDWLEGLIAEVVEMAQEEKGTEEEDEEEEERAQLDLFGSPR